MTKELIIFTKGNVRVTVEWSDAWGKASDEEITILVRGMVREMREKFAKENG